MPSWQGFDREAHRPLRASRRHVLAWFGATAAFTRAARAQKANLPLIGYLGLESPGPYASRLTAFRQGLAEAGYSESRNVAIEFRWAEGQYERLPTLAQELVARRIDVLAAPGGAPVALAAKAATATIPIVFEMGGDPVSLRVVDDLARPRGNATGISSLSVEVSRKRLEFMHETMPGAAALTVAVNATSPTATSQVRSLQAAAESLGVHLRITSVTREDEFEPVFAGVAEQQTGGLVFTSDPYFANRSRLLAELGECQEFRVRAAG